MSKTDNNGWPESWPAWVVEILERLDGSVDQEDSLNDWGGIDGPEWVQQMGMELIKIMNPTVVLNKQKTSESGPRVLGALIGHHQWLMDSENGLPKQLEIMAHALDIIGGELRTRLTPEQYQQLEQAGQNPVLELICPGEAFYRITQAQKAIITDALTAASKAPVNERAEFHRAYSKALSTGLFDEQGRPVYEKYSSTTNIYFLMMFNWKAVKEFKSITELYTWLCQKLGEKQVGNLDRVKVICKRHQVKLASRGRPKKMPKK